jgi:SRSO17 transposase
MDASPVSWEEELERWLAPFRALLNRPAQKQRMAVYLKGLVLPGERKSLEPMAARVAPGDLQQLHHFLATSPWPAWRLEDELIRQADALLGGPEALLVIDDTALIKQGKRSVGVARQYCGCLGKTANCQVLVSLTLARDEVPLPLVLRLFLPDAWVDDPARCDEVGVPASRRQRLPKTELALEELDRLLELGVRFGHVAVDAGYGISAAFRHGLSARGLSWAAGIPKKYGVYPASVVLTWPERTVGRPRKHPVPETLPVAAATMLADAAWRSISWRRGTKGPLRATFAALRVRPAEDDAAARDGIHLPGDEVWLVGEHRATGEFKYYLSNLPADATLERLAGLIKARWVCEQAHQQLKEELGLDHLECRSWRALRHHVLLTTMAFTFLQQRRLGGKRRRGQTDQAGAAATTKPAGGAATPDCRADRDRDPMPGLPSSLRPLPTALKVAR